MSSDFPFRAEYAKSNRSSCKKCKNKIDKDTLRLAIMVQSPHFDGRIPNWYHKDCFFLKAKSVEIESIEMFDSLRWDDQQAIRKVLDGGSKGAHLNSDFKIEYARSGRSKCRICNNLIAKADIRVAKLMQESEEAERFGPYEVWYHIHCFKSHRDEMEFFEKVENVPGFKDLDEEDQINSIKLLNKSSKRKIEEPDLKKKQQKTIDEKEEKELKKQSKAIFKYRDWLQENLKKSQLIELLSFNDQEPQTGESQNLDLLSDIMCFGALSSCNVCNGQILYRQGIYRCSGNMSEWTKCQETIREPKRTAFKIPVEYIENYDFLKKYKYVKRVRKLIPEVVTPELQKSESGVSPVNFTSPLRGIQFSILGKLKSYTHANITKKIIELGGTVNKTFTSSVQAIIANLDELSMTKSIRVKFKKAESWKISIVDEDFVDKVYKDSSNALKILNDSIISSWKHEITVENYTKIGRKERSMYVRDVPSKMTVTMKGGAFVEPDSGLSDVTHVYSKDGKIVTAVLGLVDVNRGTNSYYKLQVLESDHGNRYWVFRAWGRLGTTIGGNKLDSFDSAPMAMASFMKYYEEKTGNVWNCKKFTKHANKFYPMEIDYGNEEEEIEDLNLKNSKSKLPLAVQDLVGMIFDINSMKRTLKEFEIDLKKMPLGKISKTQVESAYKILTEVLKVVKADSDKNKLLDASNKFYTLIPHDFGMKKPPLLDSESVVKNKIEMLDSLLEIEIVYSMMKNSSKDTGDDRIDTYYKKLMSDITPLDKSSNEFELINKYVKNTHGATHSSYSLNVLEAFEIERHGEDKRFKPFAKLHNKKLLWHGSRTSNYGGILSQGLRIAPPEAPVTGYMFGKGIYFADMVSKSANYCFTSRSQPIGIMILCEVALGNMYELEHSSYIEKLPSGKHSTKGMGSNYPNPKESVTIGDDIEVPLGSTSRNRKTADLLYNEYIVYDVSQVRMKYLLKMEFDYKY